jgi:periplasmic nitrate reductase NapD
MHEAARPTTHHISSAVVTAFPERCAELAQLINALPGTEVHHVENGKIVVVLEGADSNIIGGRLAAIALMDGVISANLVFEQIENLDDPGAAP